MNGLESIEFVHSTRMYAGRHGIHECLLLLLVLPPPSRLSFCNQLSDWFCPSNKKSALTASFSRNPLPQFLVSDGFNTLRSVRSHVTEVSSVMTANVSDPPSSGGGGGGVVSQLAPPSQLSPPQPISTLQHNYSNIQQPAAMLPTPPNGLISNGHSSRPMGPSSLPSTAASSRTHSASPGGSGSPFAQPQSSHQNAAAAAAVPASQGQQQQQPSEQPQSGAFSRSAVRPRTPQEERMRKRERNMADEARKSRMAELQDLIHLEAPLSEDAIMRTLQARFFNQKYYVSTITTTVSFLCSGFYWPPAAYPS